MRELIAGLTQLPGKVLVDKKCQVLPTTTKIHPYTLIMAQDARGLYCQRHLPHSKKGEEALDTSQSHQENPRGEIGQDINSKFTEVEVQMSSKSRKKGSTSLAVKEATLLTAMAPFFVDQIEKVLKEKTFILTWAFREAGARSWEDFFADGVYHQDTREKQVTGDPLFDCCWHTV